MKRILPVALLLATFLPTRAQESTRGERREALQAARRAALTTDPGVVIGSLRWATRNVDTPGRFTLRSRDRGGYFSYQDALTACPAGWRAPTVDESMALASSPGGWARLGLSVGWMVTDGRGGALFLPAAGFRGPEGQLGHIWKLGTYQSSTPVDDHGASQGYVNHGLIFNNREISRSTSMSRSSLRCVFDESAAPPWPPPASAPDPTMLVQAPPSPPSPPSPAATPPPATPVGLTVETPLSGMIAAWDPGTGTITTPSLDSLQLIDPVTVTAQRQQRVNVGYGTLSPGDMSSFGTVVDLSRAHLYPDLITFLRGNAGAGVTVNPETGNMFLSGLPGSMLVVVDGMAYDPNDNHFDLKLLEPEQIASIYIDKVGTMYGARGMYGVLVITTKNLR